MATVQKSSNIGKLTPNNLPVLVCGLMHSQKSDSVSNPYLTLYKQILLIFRVSAPKFGVSCKYCLLLFLDHSQYLQKIWHFEGPFGREHLMTWSMAKYLQLTSNKLKHKIEKNKNLFIMYESSTNFSMSGTRRQPIL